MTPTLRGSRAQRVRGVATRLDPSSAGSSLDASLGMDNSRLLGSVDGSVCPLLRFIEGLHCVLPGLGRSGTSPEQGEALGWREDPLIPGRTSETEAGCLKSSEAGGSGAVSGSTDGFGVPSVGSTVHPLWGTGMGATLGRLKADAANPEPSRNCGLKMSLVRRCIWSLWLRFSGVFQFGSGNAMAYVRARLNLRS